MLVFPGCDSGPADGAEWRSTWQNEHIWTDPGVPGVRWEPGRLNWNSGSIWEHSEEDRNQEDRRTGRRRRRSESQVWVNDGSRTHSENVHGVFW